MFLYCYFHKSLCIYTELYYVNCVIHFNDWDNEAPIKKCNKQQKIDCQCIWQNVFKIVTPKITF